MRFTIFLLFFISLHPSLSLSVIFVKTYAMMLSVLLIKKFFAKQLIIYIEIYMNDLAQKTSI